MTDSENDGDGGRTKRVTFYVTEDEREALKREANDAGKSLSGYVLQLIRRQRQLDREEELAENLNVEERLAEITQQAVEDIDDSVSNVEDATDALRDLQARAGTYPLVNFRLLMRQYGPPEPWVNDQFKWASTKLKQPLSEHDPLGDVGAESRESDTENEENDGPASDVDDLL